MIKKTQYLKLFGIVATLALLGSVWACYPGGTKDVSESDVVFTFYDKGMDYSRIKTYAMPDQVYVREGSDEVSNDFDELILSEVAKNMAQLGYVREMSPDVNGADALVVVSKARQTTTSVGWVPGGGWGWPWPGWGWGPGYGWWYPYPVVTSFTTGTVFIDMFDPNDTSQGDMTVPALWSGVMNGLASSHASTTSSRIVRDIGQAYRQSPYLGTN